MENNNLRVSIIEDNSDYREVIVMGLERFGFKNIQQFATAEISLRYYRDNNVQLPQVIFLDLQLPGMGGLDAIPALKRVAPSAKIILLTRSDKEEDVLRAIYLGVAGYLLKSSKIEAIVEAISTVIDGGASLDAKVAKFILGSLRQRIDAPNQSNPLSKREQDTLALLATGLSKKAIGEKLGVSYSTIDTHIRHIYDKLNVNNAHGAINKAHSLGLIPRSESSGT